MLRREKKIRIRSKHRRSENKARIKYLEKTWFELITLRNISANLTLWSQFFEHSSLFHRAFFFFSKELLFFLADCSGDFWVAYGFQLIETKTMAHFSQPIVYKSSVEQMKFSKIHTHLQIWHGHIAIQFSLGWKDALSKDGIQEIQ